MRRTILTVSFLVGLMALAGCASRPSHVNAPDLSDPAWTPPGEMSLTVHSAPPPLPTPATAALAAPQPNRREIRDHQIHAATY